MSRLEIDRSRVDEIRPFYVVSFQALAICPLFSSLISERFEFLLNCGEILINENVKHNVLFKQNKIFDVKSLLKMDVKLSSIIIN